MNLLNDSRQKELISAIVSHYAAKKTDDFGYLEIRAELQQKGLDEPTIGGIIKIIDRIVLSEIQSSRKSEFDKTLLMTGWVLMLGGAILTVGTYGGFIAAFQGVYVVAWGPIVAGYLMIRSAKRNIKKASTQGPVHRKRFHIRDAEVENLFLPDGFNLN